MGRFSVDFSESLTKLAAQRDALESMARPISTFDWARRHGATMREPVPLGDRYGAFGTEAAHASAGGRDYVFLGVIDWAYRIQRPQHFATQLADAGNRVFYVSIAFEQADSDGRCRILTSPHPGVYELRLRLTGDVPLNIYAGFSNAQIADIRAALDEAMVVFGLRGPAIVVQYPSWYPIAIAIPGALLVYDCLDLMAGFENVPRNVLELEKKLIEGADVLFAASQPLAEHLAAQRSAVVVRNAADVDFFASPENASPAPNGHPVIGYFGAIAEWFAVDWIGSAAAAHPEWRFVIAGRIDGADVRDIREMPNVDFIGELPYLELPATLATFDVAIIPFKMSKLIECVNPVKLYEYMAQGKPVVSCAMPEVIASTDLAYVAHDSAEFEAQISRALREDGPGLRTQRRAWGLEHTWRSRAEAVTSAVEGATPLVSVVVLCYNNLEYTRACLHSLLTLSEYSNFEVIAVDNASTDGTAAFLQTLARHDLRVKPIINASNTGFAAGNNAGITAAAGEYVIVLNNDTYVTRGWIRDLIRPLMLDPAIGLAGPLTNNIGNAQKVSAHYSSMAEMATFARQFSSARSRERFEAACVAFFCVAMRRDIIERVGLLDEAFGIGFFEDDDYCKRVLAAGLRIVIADDVFIHHHLSASFNKVPAATRAALMDRNKALFEERWGTWVPHRYRDETGFGA